MTAIVSYLQGTLLNTGLLGYYGETYLSWKEGSGMPFSVYEMPVDMYWLMQDIKTGVEESMPASDDRPGATPDAVVIT